MAQSTLFILLRAGRWRVSVAAALAAVSGALFRRPSLDARTAGIFTGVLLFALACTWINQIQERSTDGLMRRTMNRPLPRERLSARDALRWAGFCLAASLPLLYVTGCWLAVAIPVAALGLYNGLYTPMKARSLLALLPGALAGATPPVVGWVCAGGPLDHRAPAALFLLFILWQVPHFWLAAEREAPDYENAGFPVPWRLYGSGLYGHLLTLWLAAFCVMLLALPAFGLLRSGGAQAAIVLAAGCTLASRWFPVVRPRGLFHVVNLSMAAVCAILVAEGFFRG